MTYSYKTKGVCARQIDFEIENDTIVAISFVGGCPGNLKGISSLVVGMKVDDVIERCKGIHCGLKPTSCPDQFSCALESYKADINS